MPKWLESRKLTSNAEEAENRAMAAVADARRQQILDEAAQAEGHAAQEQARQAQAASKEDEEIANSSILAAKAERLLSTGNRVDAFSLGLTAFEVKSTAQAVEAITESLPQTLEILRGHKRGRVQCGVFARRPVGGDGER